jgi:hypothetical protein
MLDRTEKEKRRLIIRKAMLIYGETTGKNITESLRLYLENNATEDEQIPLEITESTVLRELRLILITNRPTCEECGLGLKMKQNETDLDGIVHSTAWVCDCGRIEYSDRTPEEWLEILRENRG